MINSFLLNDLEMYLLHNDHLDIININTGKKVRTIQTTSDKLRFDFNKYPYFWSKRQQMVFVYNSNSDFLKQIRVEDDFFDFIIFKTGNIFYLK